MHARWRPTAVAAVASGLTIGLMAANMGVAGGSAGPQTAPDGTKPSAEAFERKAPQREVHRVTLITGDRVTLLPGPDGSWRATPEPAKGRAGVTFRTFRTGDQHYVIPSDTAALVAKGMLDQRLFDVAGLTADGYDDRDAKTIPVIVTYKGSAGRAAVESSGADQTRKLPSINGAAVRVEKKDAAAFLESVAGSRAEARLAAGVEKVWLDGKRKPLLEQSVPQIGAPAAWDAGYTGEGVKVAVLDGGVEATHPDLAGQVAESKNFSESPDGDPDGHGTHVAGTVAGTGSASDGRRKGVAPDAAILDGKVCEDGGWCQESAILAGMQWAATEKDADVINLSLGGTDTPEIDPLEEAVNTLTEQTGALFVIAAGNGGDWDEPVGSPGSADAALTIGAVDKTDELASFSSRGPRVGDGAIKPDLTAPGVDIVAAKSERAWIGEPVDEQYMRLSGTSMAAPHVAGSAALLAQQHPDWKATELKAALMASAKAHPEQGVFEQGAGRVDVAAAIEQSVFATTPSLSFGTAKWPHDDDAPIVKTVTYRNTGNAAVTLELTASLSGPEGEPAPDGAISLSATEVTVPAGGEANVEVTMNTNHDGADGLYSGRIIATDEGGRAVSVPAGVNKEVESYDLTLRHLGPDGTPTGFGFSSILGLDKEHFGDLWDEDGEVTARLPKGRYHLDSVFFADDGSSVHHVVQPILALEKDASIDVDARTAKPVTHSVPNPDAVLSLLDLASDFEIAGGSANLGIWVLSPDTKAYTRSVGESRPDDEFVGTIASQWSAGDGTSSPSSYALFDYRRGSYLTGHTMTPKDGDFATVVSKVHAPGVERTGTKGFFPVVPGGGGSSASLFGNQLPATTTEHLHAAPEVDWFTWLNIDDPSGDDWVATAFSPDTTYRAGRTYRERWNAAVLGLDPVRMGAERTDDQLEFWAAPSVDSSRHAWGYETKEASAKLFRNGQLLAESDWTELVADGLPAERGDFRLEISAVRDPVLTGPISTRVDSVWTFGSAASENPDGEVLPLWVVRHRPKVDGFNAMKRQDVTRLPLRVESTLGKDAAKLRKIVVEVSGDDGKTWRTASVKRTGDGRYLAVFKTPKGKAVSLRATVADKAGNTAKQTIIAAYLLR